MDTSNADNTNQYNNISALDAETLQHIIASVKTTNPDQQYQNTASNSTSFNVSFYDSNSNPATATSSQIGEYTANARKKARNIKAFSSYKISSRTFNKPTIMNISAKHKSQLNTYLSKDEMLPGCKLGMDNHADISCVGKNGRVLEVIEGQTSIVRPFNDKDNPILNVQTVNVVFAVDAINGDTYILHVNQ